MGSEHKKDMHSKTESIVTEAIQFSGIKDYTGICRGLGHGELNETYLLDCTSRKLILRIAKHTDQETLKREAYALTLLKREWAPQLVYFNADQKIDGRMWILETYIEGQTVSRLSPQQFFELGRILAEVHGHTPPQVVGSVWNQLLKECSVFGNEEHLLTHSYERLRHILQDAKQQYIAESVQYAHIHRSLIHSDATPSNILITADGVALIDWELAQYKDPMAEFSTVYYEDIEYNQGKWRLKITPEEKSKLFAGYESAGGKIDEERIRFWIRFDKIGAAVFLWWRLYESGRSVTEVEARQYLHDLNTIVDSLSC